MMAYNPKCHFMRNASMSLEASGTPKCCKVVSRTTTLQRAQSSWYFLVAKGVLNTKFFRDDLRFLY